MQKINHLTLRLSTQDNIIKFEEKLLIFHVKKKNLIFVNLILIRLDFCSSEKQNSGSDEKTYTP
jgi:hypothetical protein